MINPWIIVAVLLAILGAGAGGFKLGADHEVASQARNDEQIKKVEDAVIAANATAIAQIKPRYTTIQGKLEKQYETQTVFRDCKLDDVSFRLLNEALASPSDQKAGRVVSDRKPFEGLLHADAPTP